MDLTSEDYKDIRQVAFQVKRRWPTVDVDDLVQEASLELLTRDCEKRKGKRGAFVAMVAKSAMLDWIRWLYQLSRKPSRRMDYRDADTLAHPVVEHEWVQLDAAIDAQSVIARYKGPAAVMLRLRFLCEATPAECRSMMKVSKDSFRRLRRKVL